MYKRFTGFMIFFAGLLMFIFGASLVRLYTDWIWFAELGYIELLSTPLLAKLLIAPGVGMAAFILWFFNIRATTPRGGNQTNVFRFVEGKLRLDLTKYTRPLATAITALLALFTGLAAAANWETILKYLNATPFNAVDPIFGRDIGFYFFTLPFIQLILGLVLWILLVALITAAIFYGTRGAFTLSRNLIQFDPRSRIHLFLIVAALFLISAIRAWYVKIPNLLFNNHEIFAGASYTNLHADIPLLKLLAAAALLTALAIIYAMVRQRVKFALYAIAAYLLIAILGQGYPWALQRFVVGPNELVKESAPIEYNIAATRAAYGLDAVEERELTGEGKLTAQDIQDNGPTINNIRLWDREPLLDTFGQLQEIRTYYDFISVDNDRYHINGDYRQMLLSTRELNADSLPSDTFINRHFVFTHGYGLTLSPVNEVTPEGLPVLFVKNIPPQSDFETLAITRPEIYYGQLSHEPIFVNTKARELDYPAGDENVFTVYQGQGGVPIGNILRKAMFALRFSSLKMFLSNDISPESRVMYYRDIDARVRRVAPFLRFDSDPYLVITAEGRLKWIQDAYTTADQYPYSTYIALHNQFEGGAQGNFQSYINYIRNSVKIVTDAYDGSIQLYVSDPDDPLIQTYARIFPTAFEPLKNMPPDLRAHLRYPEDLFVYQTALYRTYHMNEPQTFYNKEDEWQIPTLGSKLDPLVRHLIMKLPGEQDEEFILMLPFTPRGKDNLAAWMVARADNEHYGKLVVYKFPKQKLVFGPAQIQNRINQDADISQQISLWDQGGSEVIQGNLMVIPLNESLLYVQPLYLRSSGGRIPELKRVIVAYENQIAMEPTLDAALARIFTGASSTVSSLRPRSEDGDGAISFPPELLHQARAHYDAALSAQRRGDWSQYGEEIRKLGEILKQLK
ncbi:UPF0182 family protein [Candidatus Uhrbacteria bacterium]|nr:UPF0182 family protein [Candidatus Uhrbacteria bacterium]